MTAADFKPEFDPTPGVTGPIQGGLPTFTPINPLLRDSAVCGRPRCLAIGPEARNRVSWAAGHLAGRPFRADQKGAVADIPRR